MKNAPRHMAAVLALLACVLCRPCFSGEPSGGAAGEPGLVVPLQISAAPPGAGAGAVFPPPGAYDIPKNDFVLLQGYGGNQGRGPTWAGDASGTDNILSLKMDGAKQVLVSFDGTAATSEGPPPVFDAPEKQALHAFLGSGKMRGWFSVDRSRPGIGSGITHLVTADNPGFPIFARPNLNFEHVVNGASADMHRSLNTPRTDPMQVRVLSPASVEIFWPAATSSWGIDCRMRYTFAGDNAIDMEFEATPRKDEAPKGWLLFMWASYMQMVRARTIYFLGTNGGAEKWMSFGYTGKSGTVAGKDQPDLPQDDGYQRFNAETDRDVRFTQPFYYGLRDADMDPGTTDDTMAYIMMFDDPRATRFAVWNWGNDPAVSAWDWQFVIRNPEVGRTYSHRSRLVCKPFSGEDDVLAEYTAWRDSLSRGLRQQSLPLAAFPVCLAPGTSAYSHEAIMARVAVENPDLALGMCRGMLASTLHAAEAASLIDEIAGKKGGASAVAKQWESVVSEQPQNALAWHHLGQAREKENCQAKAAEAYAKALETDRTRIPTRLRLGVVRVKLGETESGLALVDGALQRDAGLARATAMECADLAETCRKSGEAKSAVDLYRLAVACSPDNTAYRMLCGETLESTGDFDGALQQYRRVMTMSPESSYAALRIDGVYQGRGDPVGLVSEWQCLSAACPAAFMPAFRLGLALEAEGDTVAAKAVYEEALRRCPGRAEPRVRLAGLAAAVGDVEQGLQIIAALAAEGGEDTAGHAARACGGAARARVIAGDFRGAAALLREACLLSPRDLSHRVALGEALEAAGDGDGALAEYREVAAEMPDAPYSGRRIDGIFLRRNDPAGRVAEWRRMVAAHPAAAVPRMHLGLALEAAGDAVGAATAYREALSHDASVEADSLVFRSVKDAARSDDETSKISAEGGR